MRTGDRQSAVWNTRTLSLKASDTICTEKSEYFMFSVPPPVPGMGGCHGRVSPPAASVFLMAV